MNRALGVIVSQFPRYDEAFILRELVALSQGEQELVIFSLRPCHDRIIHAQAKALQPSTVYAPFLWSVELWRSQAYFLRHASTAYWSALGWILSRHWNHPMTLLKTLALFPKTVHFARLAKARGVSQLHAFWATYPATSAVVISRLTGIPYSLSGHAHDLYTTNPALVEKIRGARFVVTCTEANKRYLEKISDGFASLPVRQFARSPVQPANRPTGQPANIIVNYHGVDLTRFVARPKPTRATCHILSVGSLLPCKGLETLIEGCRLLRQRGVPFHCTIAGGGPLERRLRRLIARYGLAHQVRITGFVSQETVVQLYQDADLFVLPLVSKRHWGIPNALIEALATKTPVISCALPSLKELIEHERSGWVIPEQDPQSLAQVVEYLWSNAALRSQLAEAGYSRVVERFSLERTGAQLRSLFAIERANPAQRGQRANTSMRHALRRTLSNLTYQAIRLSDGHRAGLRILMYHRVTDAHPGDRLCVPVDHFARQMRYLHEQGYHAISVSQAVRWLTMGTALPARAVVITFDDGYEDNFLHAAPVLARYGFPAGFFVPSGFIASSANGRQADDRPMSWEQLRELVARGHEIGAHSIHHHRLTRLDPVEMSWEVRGSKETLAHHLQRPVESFCYPAGDYNDLVKRAVKASGYLGACTVEPGANHPGADPFALKRTEISAFDSLWDFEKKLAGAYDWLHLAVQQVQRLRPVNG
jgi:glycosyltransferase involved in cell wall biosynthesis/peptidoglycan/xylan/chitin deacetylase (PgdA/CDA1 family)